MKKALIFMANGFEEMEAVILTDVLRRAGVQADMCSIHDTLAIKGAHGIAMQADKKLSDLKDTNSYDAFIVPGGMPGAKHLRDDERVTRIFASFFDKPGKILATICAAPIVLGKAGIGPKIMGTCYPGFETEAGFKEYKKQAVVVDKNVFTSMGPGTAFCLALHLAAALVGDETAERLKEGMLLHMA